MRIVGKLESTGAWAGRRLRVAVLTLAGGVALVAVILGMMAGPARAAGPAGVGGKRGFETMTVNLYLGTDILPIYALDPNDEQYLAKLVAAVTKAFGEVDASRPDVRMDGVGATIAARQPDAVSVEEGTLLQMSVNGDVVTVYDYVQMVVAALEARGLHYAVAAEVDETDILLPIFDIQTNSVQMVRMLDRDVILVRTDLPPGQLRVGNPQSGNFENVLTIPGLGVSFLRGWCSVDVFVRGLSFRYICAHLEIEAFPELQEAQAMELMAGPADVNVPVVICGDFNCDPLKRDGAGALAYDVVRDAGFADTWAALNPGNLAGGLTWGHDSFLADSTVAFDRRIDFVFYRGGRLAANGLEVVDMTLEGAQPPRWASDHAAVWAALRF